MYDYNKMINKFEHNKFLFLSEINYFKCVDKLKSSDNEIQSDGESNRVP